MKMFATRADAIKCNAEEAARALREAAKAKARGDKRAVKKWVEWALECDETATRFAAGEYDDVIARP